MKTNRRIKSSSLSLAALLVLAAPAFVAAGCDDDAATGNGLMIAESHLTFDAPASSDGYVLASDPSCTASAEDTWCSVTRRGDTLVVSVTDNLSLESRHTAIVLTSPSGSVRLPVSQSGAYFRLDSDSVQHATDSAATLNITVSSAFPYEVASSEPWLTAPVQSDGLLTLTLEPNHSGAPRIGTALVHCPTLGRSFSVNVLQYNLSDLMGDWTAISQTNSNVERTASVSLSARTDGRFSLSGLATGITLLADSAGAQGFGFTTGTYLGLYESRGTSYRIYQYGATGDHQVRPSETRTIHYASHLSATPEGVWTLTFSADSTFTDGLSMQGIAVMADMNGSRRSVDEFYNLTLKR